MKTLGSKKQVYFQPETEVLEMKFQTSLLGSSGAAEACTSDCEEDDWCPDN